LKVDKLHSSKIKRSKNSINQRFSSLLLLVDGIIRIRSWIRIRTNKLGIRKPIQEAKKDLDPDPEHCTAPMFKTG
jgi:hypothetical protein